MSSTVMPTLRYHDAPAAITFLCDAFGFERHLVVEDGSGGIAHCQLTRGDGMLMLGSVSEGRRFDELITTVRDSGMLPTACIFLVIDDVDGAADRVVAAGGEILDPVTDQDHGGRAFTCADPEGNLWNIGSYDPWVSP